jgi:hypothetical protein
MVYKPPSSPPTKEPSTLKEYADYIYTLPFMQAAEEYTKILKLSEEKIHVIFRLLGQRDLYFLLTNILRRPDATNGVTPDAVKFKVLRMAIWTYGPANTSSRAL